MINQEDVLDIVLSAVDIRKKRTKQNSNKKDVPEYFMGYNEYVKWKDEVSNHTVKGKIPYELISVKAPNQSQEELDYIIANYKQVTLPVSFEFLTTIGRGLHDSNWSIDYEEDDAKYINADMSFKDYVDYDIAETPLHMSFDAWMKFVLPSIKLNDAMGVVAYKPYTQEKTIINEDGEEVIAGDSLLEPIPFYYSSDRVMSDMDWGYLLVETNRYSVIDRGGKSFKEGLIFELWDDQNIWTIEQFGKQHEWRFEVKLYFNHQLGFIPAKYLMGSTRYHENGSLYYQSPFLMVTDILDEALLDATMLRSVKAASVYPQKVMIGNACMFQDEYNNSCANGYILNKENSGFYKCPDCNGTGMAQRTGALNTILVKGGKNGLDEPDNIKPTDALSYVSPPIDVPVFLREEIEKAILHALSILHLKTTNTAVKGAEDMTATGMMMDEKGKYAFIKSVVDQIFEHYEFGLKCIGYIRYGEDFKEPHVNRPISYDFNSEGDYLLQIAAMQEAGAPPVMISSYMYKYLQAIFYDNPNTAKTFDLIIATDRLFTMTKDQIEKQLSRNLVERWQVVLHDSALTFIEDLMRENTNFLNQEMSVMMEQLINKAKENTPAQINTPRLSPDNILANANA